MNGDMGELLASIQKFVDPFMAGSCSALIKVILSFYFDHEQVVNKVMSRFFLKMLTYTFRM